MTVIPFPEPEDYWESCPKCHRYDVFLNVRKENWVVCHRHKTKWCIGYNLFSGWLYQTERTGSGIVPCWPRINLSNRGSPHAPVTDTDRRPHRENARKH